MTLISKKKEAPVRHPGEGRDLTDAFYGNGEIPAFAGMTIVDGCPK